MSVWKERWARLAVQRGQPSKRFRFLWTVAAIGQLAACTSPQGATPMPEPPALHPTSFSAPASSAEGDKAATPVGLNAEAGSATPGATLLALNLEDQNPATSTLIAADGSFQITVLAKQYDEVRLEAELGGLRSEAVDLRIVNRVAAAVDRHPCIAFEPRSSLNFLAGERRQTLHVSSTCSEVASFGNPRLRVPDGQFAAITLPQELGPGLSEEMVLEYRPAESTDTAENVWFIDVQVGSSLIRYPFTLRGER